jgi:hypothetical protein
LQAGESNQQYLVFNRVTQDTLDKIDNARENGRIQKCTRMTHYSDTDLPIIKLMPSVAHERAHLDLAGEFLFKVAGMGLPKREIICAGAGRQEGTSSSKEGDSTFKPSSFREKDTDWPTIVFEAGLSESLGRLRTDAV